MITPPYGTGKVTRYALRFTQLKEFERNARYGPFVYIKGPNNSRVVTYYYAMELLTA